ncbi:MAG: hypothetical protein IJW39_01915 [Opitutales bacterium]|nr:hypothetical protein [Opitutales bacterium]
MPDFHNVLQGEFVFAHNAINYYLNATEVKTNPFAPDSPTEKTGWFWRFQCEAMKKDALKTMLSLLPDLKAKTPFEELVAKWKRLDDERLFSFRGIVNVEAPTIFFSRRVGFGSQIKEMIKLTIDSVEILENTNSRAKICLACQEFRKDHGRFPTSFDELVPAYLERVPVYRSHPTTSLHFDAKSGKTTEKTRGTRKTVPYEMDSETCVIFPANADRGSETFDDGEPVSTGAFRPFLPKISKL